MPEKDKAEIQSRGNFFRRLLRRGSKDHIVSEERVGAESPPTSSWEEDLQERKDHYQEAERTWESHFAGKVPKSCSMWYGGMEEFKEGGSKNPLLVEAAVLHPDYQVGHAAGRSQRLTPEQIAVVVYRSDFPDWAKEEIYEAQREMGVTVEEFRKAQKCAKRFDGGVNAKEDKSQAVAFLPPRQVREAVQPIEVVKKINPGELINKALDLLGLKRKLRPKIFYAQSPEKFQAKVNEHLKKAGVPPEGVNLQACFYSGILRECIIHPEVVRMLATRGNDLDAFNHLRHFEYVVHEVLHGAYDLLIGGGFDIPVGIIREEELHDFNTETLEPFEEYMVSIVAHDVVIQLRDEIMGRTIRPSLLEAFVRQNKASSLNSAQEEHFSRIFGKLVSEDDSKKARFFVEKWKAPGGANRVLVQYLQTRGQ